MSPICSSSVCQNCVVHNVVPFLPFLDVHSIFQTIWHKEWLLDLLALWALSSSKETHKAKDLLKSMKSRCVLYLHFMVLIL